MQLVDAQGANVSVLTELQMCVQLRSHPLFRKKITVGARTLIHPDAFLATMEDLFDHACTHSGGQDLLATTFVLVVSLLSRERKAAEQLFSILGQKNNQDIQTMFLEVLKQAGPNNSIVGPAVPEWHKQSSITYDTCMLTPSNRLTQILYVLSSNPRGFVWKSTGELRIDAGILSQCLGPLMTNHLLDASYGYLSLMANVEVTNQGGIVVKTSAAASAKMNVYSKLFPSTSDDYWEGEAEGLRSILRERRRPYRADVEDQGVTLV